MSQVRCVFCDGSGVEVCGFCDGGGHRYLGRVCDSCGGRGLEKCCGPCYGTGLVEESLVAEFPASWLADAARTHAALCAMARRGRPHRTIALSIATALIDQQADPPPRRTLLTSIALAVSRIVIGTGEYVLSEEEERLCRAIGRKARHDTVGRPAVTDR